MDKILYFINPISRLGRAKYSILVPFLGCIFAAAALEFATYILIRDTNLAGLYAVFLFVTLVIYFAFRDGVLGGLIATTSATGYYLFILYSRNYQGAELSRGIETIVVLALLDLFLSGVIGGLRQKIDSLVQRELDGRVRLQAIVQQLPVGVVITDSTGVIQNANKRADEILGIEVPIGFKLGEKTFVEGKIGKRNISGSSSVVTQALETGKPVVNREFEINRPDGRRVYIQVSASIIKNSENKTIAAASIITDVTAHREMELRKDDFVNMASHELKTPITSMKLYIEMLTDLVKESKDIKTTKIVSSLAHQTGRLQKLVGDLLDVSRLQTGKMTFSKEKFRIDLLVKNTIDEIGGFTEGKKIEYKSKSSAEVFADKLRIYQVISNLITNAVKYSGESEEIYVNLKKQGKSVVVSVQDFGIGIDPSQHKKIFERLYQVNDGRGNTFPGFGMGLYISKAIVKKHKGNIWVDSEMGKGSIFSFSLPIYT